MAAKFFTGLKLDDPDPECVLGHGERLLSIRPLAEAPRPSVNHSRDRPYRGCDEDPLAGLPRGAVCED